MAKPNPEMHPIARRATVIRLLAKCPALGLRVWMRHGIVQFGLLNGYARAPTEQLAAQLKAYKTEIADIIGHNGQRHIQATEILGGCRVYWLPQPEEATANSGSAAWAINGNAGASEKPDS